MRANAHRIDDMTLVCPVEKSKMALKDKMPVDCYFKAETMSGR